MPNYLTELKENLLALRVGLKRSFGCLILGVLLCRDGGASICLGEHFLFGLLPEFLLRKTSRCGRPVLGLQLPKQIEAPPSRQSTSISGRQLQALSGRGSSASLPHWSFAACQSLCHKVMHLQLQCHYNTAHYIYTIHH